MKKKILLITGLILFIAGLKMQAQNQLYGPATNVANIRSISPNGKYLVGQLTSRNGFTWDITSGKYDNFSHVSDQ